MAKSKKKRSKNNSSFFEHVKVVLSAVLLALVVRSFIVEPYKIPSSSMVPTLLVGDYLFVDKMSYGIKIPFTDTRFFKEQPKRGDIAVFKRDDTKIPGSFFGLGSTYFIKRVIGLPGDEVAFINKRLYINGQQIPLTDKNETVVYENGGHETSEARLYSEDLLGVEHPVLIHPERGSRNVAVMSVPENHYVFMGDNRDNSHDARAWKYPSWGFIPHSALAGQAEFIFWSWGQDGLRSERLFKDLAE